MGAGNQVSDVNMAAEYLSRLGETPADWDGICGELAGTLAKHHGGSILYVEGDAVYCSEHGWWYHMVLLDDDGLVHDAWCDGPALPTRDWLVKMFGSKLHVEVSLNGDTIFDGKCQHFDDGLVERKAA